MKILITGATGFVGKHLVRGLLTKGYEISCLVRDAEQAKKLFGSQVQWIQCDLSNFSANDSELYNFFQDFDVVCHLAAIISSRKTEDFYNINVRGTEILCCLLRSSRKLKKIIYLSSLAVIGNVNEIITEKTVCKPFSPYGKSKLLAENILSLFQKELPMTQLFIIRTPIIYGEEQSGAILNFFEKIRSKSMSILGNGKNYRAMCYVQNLIEGIIVLIESENIQKIEIINIADREQLSLNNLILLIAKKNKVNILIKSRSKFIAILGLLLYRFLNLFGYNSTDLFVLATASANICCDIRKALSMKIPISYSLDLGLENTANWLLKYQNKCTYIQ